MGRIMANAIHHNFMANFAIETFAIDFIADYATTN